MKEEKEGEEEEEEEEQRKQEEEEDVQHHLVALVVDIGGGVEGGAGLVGPHVLAAAQLTLPLLHRPGGHGLAQQEPRQLQA